MAKGAERDKILEEVLTFKVGMAEPDSNLEQEPSKGDDTHGQPDPPLLVGETPLSQDHIPHSLAVRSLQRLPAWGSKLIDGQRLLCV